jgi:CRISPR/Cas system-associated exonuclease Cas4 (RecB family)
VPSQEPFIRIPHAGEMDSKKQKQEREAIDALVARLSKKYPNVSKSDVQEIVQSQYSRLKDAKLRDYIPVLVEHSSKQVLKKRNTKRG